MNNFLDINDRILFIIENQLNGNKKKFAEKIGFAPQVIANIVSGRKSKPSFDVLSAIKSSFDDINSEWLLTGNGPMLKQKNVYQPTEDAAIAILNEPSKEYYSNNLKPIPFISQRVAAGFGGEDFSIREQDVKAYYVIPKFKHRKIDFMIEITGSSMYPKYNSGDVIACTIIKESRFIQWNKCHVIATLEQGLLVKRIKEGKDAHHILAVSDNKEYLVCVFY